MNLSTLKNEKLIPSAITPYGILLSRCEMSLYYIFQIYPVFVWLVLFFAFVRPLKLRPIGQVACGTTLLVASQKFVVYGVFGKNVFNPDLPGWLILGSGWLYAATIMLFIAVAALFLGGICLRLIRRGRPIPAADDVARLRQRRRMAVVLVAAALSISAFGIWEGARVPSVHEVDLAFADLPPAFDGYRIVQLSDLHVSPATRAPHIRAIVERVNALKPDLVAITGDFVDGAPAKRAADLAPIKGLQAADGVFGCTGNHEYYSNYNVWRPIFASFGVNMLENAHHDIIHGGDVISLGGINDPAGWRGRVADGPDAERAFAGTPGPAFKILLAHRPTGTKANEETGVRLQLSGHTHGGGIWGLHLLVARMGNEGHVNGLYHGKDKSITLYVSPGTGQWAGFPLRLGENAEITLLVLHHSAR